MFSYKTWHRECSIVMPHKRKTTQNCGKKWPGTPGVRRTINFALRRDGLGFSYMDDQFRRSAIADRHHVFLRPAIVLTRYEPGERAYRATFGCVALMALTILIVIHSKAFEVPADEPVRANGPDFSQAAAPAYRYLAAVAAAVGVRVPRSPALTSEEQ